MDDMERKEQEKNILRLAELKREEQEKAQTARTNQEAKILDQAEPPLVQREVRRIPDSPEVPPKPDVPTPPTPTPTNRRILHGGHSHDH